MAVRGLVSGRGPALLGRMSASEPFDGTCATSFLFYNALSRYACIFLRKSLIVFCMRQVMVIGPTPPGTGVITDAIGSTAS